MSGDTYTEASAEDGAWFRQHPRRRFRLRPIVEAERERLQAPTATHVCVEKITSCARVRRPVMILGEVPDHDRALARLVREGFAFVENEATA